MAVFMVERDLPGASVDDLRQAQQAAMETSREFTARGRPVRYIRSTFVPGESLCMCLFEAADPDVVKQVNEQARIPFSRIKPALDLTP
jgi:muconolactone delta-isomerase